MWMQHPIVLVCFGALVGAFSSLLGVGGGILIIPILVLVMDFEQPKAHGTSLAMILSPMQLPAILNYHRQQLIDWWLVMWVICGTFMGSYWGSKLATSISPVSLKIIFGFVLVYLAAYTVFGVFGKEHMVRTLVLSLSLTAILGIMLAVVKWIDSQKV